jgi:hypothetical protein
LLLEKLSTMVLGFFARKELKMTDVGSIGAQSFSPQDFMTGNSEAPTSAPGGGTEEAPTTPTDYLSSFGGGEIPGLSGGGGITGLGGGEGITAFGGGGLPGLGG